MLLVAVVGLTAACDSTAPNDAATIDATPGTTDATNSDVNCENLAIPENDQDWTLSVGGRQRIASVHLPSGYQPSQPTPVVLNFHGYSSNASQQALVSRMIAKSDAEGFIVVHASGIGALKSWNGGVCCGVAAQQNVDDVAFVAELLNQLEARVCVDRARVFSTGLSNGGFLSHRLACELSDRIAAIAPVAGVLGIANCTPSRAVPVVHFHGTADNVVPYNGNPAINYGAVSDTIEFWTAQNHCSGEQTVFNQGDATCVAATGCDADASVTLCTISGGGHNWPGGIPFPGGGKTSTDISATDFMWDFFVAHPHPNL